jgi:hypothetical protein
MRVDPLLPRAEKLVPVLEAIGDDNVRIDSTSLDNPLVVLANEAPGVVTIEEQLHVCWAPRNVEFLNAGWGGGGQIGRRTPSGYFSTIHAKIAAVPASFAGASEYLARSASKRASVAGPAAVG